MSDLGDLFNEADANAAREAGDSRLESGEFGAVRKKVRNAHTRRAVLRTFLVAGAAFAIGAGAVSGLKYLGGTDVANPPTPSASPSVTPSATPSATPSPSVTLPAMPAFAGTVTVDPRLPDASSNYPRGVGERGAGVGAGLVPGADVGDRAGGARRHSSRDLPGVAVGRTVRTRQHPWHRLDLGPLVGCRITDRDRRYQYGRGLTSISRKLTSHGHVHAHRRLRARCRAQASPHSWTRRAGRSTAATTRLRHLLTIAPDGTDYSHTRLHGADAAVALAQSKTGSRRCDR